MKRLLLIVNILLLLCQPLYAQEIKYKIKVICVAQIGDNCRVDFQLLNEDEVPMAPVWTVGIDAKEVTAELLKNEIEAICDSYISGLDTVIINKIEHIKEIAEGQTFTFNKKEANNE